MITYLANLIDHIQHQNVLHTKALPSYQVPYSLLSQRQQRVCINGEQSTWKPVWSGVPRPQGSVLGPVLFLIFINDLDLGIVNWILKFADDTNIFSKISSITSRNTLQNDLTKLIQWSQDWQMEFNIEKM